MLQRAAPEHGVRHGTHPDKAALAQPFLIEFIRAAAEALDASDPQDGYVVEGDIVTPTAATAATALGIPLTSVFLGNTKLTPEHLRAAPDWLADADDTTYREIAARVGLRGAFGHRRHLAGLLAAGAVYSCDSCALARALVLAARSVVSRPRPRSGSTGRRPRAG